VAGDGVGLFLQIQEGREHVKCEEDSMEEREGVVLTINGDCSGASVKCGEEAVALVPGCNQ
jgi:hypothetical protein